MIKNLPDPIAIIDARLNAVNEEDLLELLSMSRLGKVAGISIESSSDLTVEHIAKDGPMEGFAAVTSFIMTSEDALQNRNYNDGEILQNQVLAVASKDDAAALFLWGALIAAAVGRQLSATSYIYESGTCPNGNPDCQVNAFTDAAYALAKDAGERHGFKIPDLGVSERRFDDGSVHEYINSLSVGRSYLSSLDAKKKADDNLFGAGAWGKVTAAEA